LKLESVVGLGKRTRAGEIKIHAKGIKRGAIPERVLSEW